MSENTLLNDFKHVDITSHSGTSSNNIHCRNENWFNTTGKVNISIFFQLNLNRDNNCPGIICRDKKVKTGTNPGKPGRMDIVIIN